MSFFELATRLYEVRWLDAKFLGDRNQVRFVRFQKTQEGGKERRIAEPAPQLVSPDSGQIEEPLRPTLVTKRCGKRSEGERHRIIWYPGGHSLECFESG